MARWIALLRGINVGGKNLLPMGELVTTLESAGCRDVRTYIQSGNVVFDSARRSAATAAEAIGDAIERCHGFKPAVFVLSRGDLTDAAARNPYPDAERVPKSLHLFFLERAPEPDRVARLTELRTGSERFAIVGSVLYLHAPDDFGRSKLAAGIERTLGVGATARNWRTVTKLIELAATGA